MPLYTFSVNHHSAPIAVRERVAFGPADLAEALESLISRDLVQEAAILSTCNRTELYCFCDDAEVIVNWLCTYRQLSNAELKQYLHILQDQQSVQHTFRVAAGLDSMVLGEPQILGQMKDAARHAKEAGTLGSLLDKLFQSAFSIAKEIRSNTAIGVNIISMAAAAVHLAGRIFPTLKEQHVLFIGAGEMIELCMTHFANHNPAQMTLANRNLERGRELAGHFNAELVRLDDLPSIMPRFDIVISSTAAPLPIIGLGLIERSLKVRLHRPMFMVDLAVPRDIEPEVGELDDIFLYTVDDLATVVSHGQESRQAAAVDAEAIVIRAADNFESWLQSRQNVPLIRTLRDSCERMRRHEVEHAQKLLSSGKPPEAVLEELSRRLTNKLLHSPMQALNETHGNERENLRNATTRLFRLPHHR